MHIGYVCGDCKDKGVVRETAPVVKAVVVGEPDYDARRKQDMVDYGCYGKVAGMMRDSVDYR